MQCDNLRVSFQSNGKVVEALRDVSFETADGEFLAVIGPSGCGKTTLLRTLAGLMTPDRGTIQHGFERARTRLVFQEDSVFPWMTVAENAAFGLEMQGVARSERQSRAHEMLARLGLEGREKDYPHQLSAGMKQRVAVAAGFLGDPALLLMDEPFAALDAQTRLQLQQQLLALWELSRCTVLFVTHDVEEAILLGDRILVLGGHPGSVVGTHRVPFGRPRSPALAFSHEFLTLKRELYAQLGMDWAG